MEQGLGERDHLGLVDPPDVLTVDRAGLGAPGYDDQVLPGRQADRPDDPVDASALGRRRNRQPAASAIHNLDVLVQSIQHQSVARILTRLYKELVRCFVTVVTYSK